MVISEVVTVFLYAISIAFLPEYFGMFLTLHTSGTPPPFGIIFSCQMKPDL